MDAWIGLIWSEKWTEIDVRWVKNGEEFPCGNFPKGNLLHERRNVEHVWGEKWNLISIRAIFLTEFYGFFLLINFLLNKTIKLSFSFQISFQFFTNTKKLLKLFSVKWIFCKFAFENLKIFHLKQALFSTFFQYFVSFHSIRYFKSSQKALFNQQTLTSVHSILSFTKHHENVFWLSS